MEERTQVPPWLLPFDSFVILGKLPNATVMWGLLPCTLYVPGPRHEVGCWQLDNYSYPGLHLVLGAQPKPEPLGMPERS